MNKYYLVWGACAVVAYQKYKDYLIRYPSIAFEEAVFSFFIVAGFFTIILLLWDWGKKRLDHSPREYKEQTQRSTEWEQACREGEIEARHRVTKQARRKAEEEQAGQEQAKRRTTEGRRHTGWEHLKADWKQTSCAEEERTRREYEQDQARRRADEELARQRAEEAKRRYEEQARRQAEEDARRKTEKEQTNHHNAVSAEIKKCFDVFELPRSASFDDVKKKYKIMIKLYHPDRHSSDDSVKEYANKKTIELNNALNTLKTKHFNES